MASPEILFEDREFKVQLGNKSAATHDYYLLLDPLVYQTGLLQTEQQ